MKKKIRVIDIVLGSESLGLLQLMTASIFVYLVYSHHLYAYEPTIYIAVYTLLIVIFVYGCLKSKNAGATRITLLKLVSVLMSFSYLLLSLCIIKEIDIKFFNMRWVQAVFLWINSLTV